jgi:hypothetical protein
MNGVPWKEIIELLRFWGWIAFGITMVKMIQTIIVEVFTRTCRHCGKRV